MSYAFVLSWFSSATPDTITFSVDTLGFRVFSRYANVLCPAHSSFLCYAASTCAGTHTATGQTRSGVLNMVDLAGSERLSKSLAADDPKTLKETQNINQSLSVFGQVFSALMSGGKAAHVPFRSSKLTHLLQVSWVPMMHSRDSSTRSLSIPRSVVCTILQCFRKMN